MCAIGLVYVCLIKMGRLFEKCRDVFIKYSKIRGLKIKKGQVRVNINQRTSGPVNAHLLSRPSKAQNIQNLDNIW